MKVKLEATGVKALEDALKKMDLEHQRQTLRLAAKDAMKPVSAAAQSNFDAQWGKTRHATGASRNQLGRVNASANKKTGKVEASVGVGSKKKGGMAGHLEVGARGIEPGPFLVPAMESQTGAVLTRLAAGVREAIDDAAKAVRRAVARKQKK